MLLERIIKNVDLLNDAMVELTRSMSEINEFNQRVTIVSELWEGVSLEVQCSLRDRITEASVRDDLFLRMSSIAATWLLTSRTWTRPSEKGPEMRHRRALQASKSLVASQCICIYLFSTDKSRRSANGFNAVCGVHLPFDVNLHRTA